MSDKHDPERENVTESNPQPSIQTSGSKKRRKREDTLFQCPQCQRAFGRIEHLRRHATSHGEDRPYKCVICSKGFNRLDTLQRHELIHQKGAGVSKFKGARACKECASAKVRCNGTLPCERCSTKGAKCFYPNAPSPANSPSSAIQETAPTSEAGPAETESYFMLESTTFSRQLEQSLPYVEEELSFHDSNNVYSPDVWAHATSPDWIQAGMEYTMHPVLQRTISHESGSQQSGLSPAGLPFTSGEVFSAMHPLRLDDENDAMEPLARKWSINCVRKPSAILDSESSSLQASSGAGEDTRMPRPSLRKRFVARGSFSISMPSATSSTGKRTRFDFPVLRTPYPISQTGAYALLDLLSEEAYTRIHRAFSSLCVGITAQAPVFASSNLPTRQTLNAFVQLYLEHFHPLMPVLHQPTIRMNRSHWLLSLALAAVGSQYSDFEHGSEYSTSLIEFLRRVTTSLNTVEDIDEVVSCQVRLLSCICLMYSGDESCQRDAQIQFSDLVSFCRSDWKLRNLDFAHTPTEIDQAESCFWEEWTMVESWHRTGYVIWLLDAMWAYQFQIQPRLSLRDGTVSLPCQEVLWESISATQWRTVFECTPGNPTLMYAIQLIHDEPQSQSATGELSRIILIHGLYHRNWEVEKYVLDQNEVWLPHVPMYAHWRESACNSIDIIHWEANAVANASGVEHPTILHLHSARIILLAPFQEICNLAYGVTKENPNITRTQITELRKSIRRWATEDDSKARLAAVHAGAIFRHLREFPTGGFHEPSAILLATLTLWAYGIFSRTTTTAGISSERRSSDLQTSPSITLDQRIEPELAQSFVQNGSGMATTITGVGDIRGDGEPEQIFFEGSKLVLQTSRWGSGRKVMRILNNLSLCRQYVEAGEAVV